MSLVISKGFGVDIDAHYLQPFKVTIELISPLAGLIEDLTAICGTMIDIDIMNGTFEDTTAICGTLSEYAIIGVIDCGQ